MLWSLALCLALLALPFLFMVAATVTQGRLLARWRASSVPLEVGAGAFVRDAVLRQGLLVQVGLQPPELGGGDGYWSGPCVIALAPDTSADRTPIGWAIAAHELGHASVAASQPSWQRWGPRVRTLGDWSGRAFLALAAVGWLCRWETGWALAGGAALLAAVFASVVAWDEARASVRGFEHATGDPRLGQAEVVKRALGAGLSVYVAGALGRWVVLALWPLTHGALLAETPSLSGSPGVLLAAALALPFLVLRGAQVVAQVAVPRPPRSVFRLLSAADEEARWSFLAGVATAVCVVAVARPSGGGLETWLAALALLPAAGPVAALGQLPLVLPLALLLRWRRAPQGDPRLERWRREDRSASAPVLEALVDEAQAPRWSALLHLSFVPFLAVAFAHMLAG